MLDKILIEKKLQQIFEYLGELKPIAKDIQANEVLKDYYKYHTAERLLQLVVDTIIDINVHLIKENTLAVPDDFQSTFITLADNGILPRDFAEQIAPVVGLRNRVVHRYETLSRRTFIELLQKNYPDFEHYLEIIKDYIDKMQ
jgi:uncharacterized protein YutE (UPF0331/DUF86 family)